MRLCDILCMSSGLVNIMEEPSNSIFVDPITNQSQVISNKKYILNSNTVKLSDFSEKFLNKEVIRIAGSSEGIKVWLSDD